VLGNWQVTGLPAGNYTVEFAHCDTTDYLPQFYPDAPPGVFGQFLPVSDGSVTTGIDAHLGLGGAIAGTVTEYDGTPAAGVDPVLLGSGTYSPGVNFDLQPPQTDATGRYRINKLYPGTSFKIEFQPAPGSLDAVQWYPNQPWQADAHPVVVSSGTTAAGIDARLAQGSISGTVTNDRGEPVPNQYVSLVPTVGDYFIAPFATDSNGHWTATRLPPISYDVHFTGNATSGVGCPYDDSWYQQAETVRSATPVTVQPQQVSSNIDGVAHDFGQLTVHVVDRQGNPIVGAQLALDRPAACQYNRAAGTTDSAGAFSVAVAHGYYQINITAPGFFDFPGRQEPTPLPVHVGFSQQQDVTVVLTRPAHLGGTVIDKDGTPLPDVAVEGREVPGQPFRSFNATTDSQGNWTSPGLYPFGWTLHFTDTDTSRTGGAYPPRNYPTFRQADTVTTSDGSNTRVPEQLIRGSYLTGRIVGPDGQPGPAGGNLNVCPTGVPRGQCYGPYTDANGQFRDGILDPGTYTLLISPNGTLGGEWWHDKPDRASADTITLLDGQTTTLNDTVPYAKPSVPATVTASAGGTTGSGTAHVSWTPSATPALDPIRYYNIVSSPAGHGAQVPGDQHEVTLTGLQNGTSYTFSVQAGNGAGLSGTTSSGTVTPQPPPTPTTIAFTRSGSSTITYGTAVPLHAHLATSSGTPLPGRTLYLQSRAHGTTAWTTLAHAATDNAGNATWAPHPTAATDYQSVFVGTPSLTSSTSTALTEQVRTAVTSTLSHTSVTLGSAVTLHTTVSPSHAGQTIYLQRLINGTWRTIASHALDRSSGWTFTLRPTARGTYTYRTYKAADHDHAASASTTRTLRVS
jgi:hypothetical protein